MEVKRGREETDTPLRTMLHKRTMRGLVQFQPADHAQLALGNVSSSSLVQSFWCAR